MSISDEIFVLLKQLVSSGQISMTVTEPEIAQLLQVSRSPVRDAFQRLTELGFLRAEGRRFEVVPVSRSYVETVEEAGEFFSALGAGLSAQSQKRADFSALASEFEKLAAESGSLEGSAVLAAWDALRRSYQELVVRECRNALLVGFMSTVSDHQERYEREQAEAVCSAEDLFSWQARACRAVADGDVGAAMRAQRSAAWARAEKVVGLFPEREERPASPYKLQDEEHGLYSKLRDDLLFDPGKSGSILVLDEMMERYRVSRTPIREALALAEIRGLVVHQHGVGSRVRERSAELFANKVQLFAPTSRWALKKVAEIGAPLPLAECAERFRALVEEDIDHRAFTRKFVSAVNEYYAVLGECAGNWIIGGALVKLANLHLFYEVISLPEQRSLFREVADIRLQQCLTLARDPRDPIALDYLEELRKRALILARIWFERISAGPLYE